MSQTHSYPKAVIVELKPLIDNYRHHSQIYNAIPIQALLETMLKIPVYCDCSEALWHVVEHYMTNTPEQDCSDLDSNMLDYITIHLEMLMEIFYRDLERVLGTRAAEKYVFHKWLGTDSVILVNKD